MAQDTSAVANNTRPTELALFKRCKRKLKKDCLYLHKLKEGSRWYSDLGSYYVTDQNNHTRMTHLNLEWLAKDLAVL